MQGDGGEGLVDAEGEGCVLGSPRDVGGVGVLEKVWGSNSCPVALNRRKNLFGGLSAPEPCRDACGEGTDGVGCSIAAALLRRRARRRGTGGIGGWYGVWHGVNSSMSQCTIGQCGVVKYDREKYDMEQCGMEMVLRIDSVVL